MKNTITLLMLAFTLLFAACKKDQNSVTNIRLSWNSFDEIKSTEIDQIEVQYDTTNQWYSIYINETFNYGSGQKIDLQIYINSITDEMSFDEQSMTPYYQIQAHYRCNGCSQDDLFQGKSGSSMMGDVVFTFEKLDFAGGHIQGNFRGKLFGITNIGVVQPDIDCDFNLLDFTIIE